MWTTKIPSIHYYEYKKIQNHSIQLFRWKPSPTSENNSYCLFIVRVLPVTCSTACSPVRSLPHFSLKYSMLLL
jgi:hypothetical protein